MNPVIVTALSVLLAAAISSVVTYLLGRRMSKAEPKRVEADTAKLLVESYSTLVGDLGDQNETMKVRVDELEAELAKRIAEAGELERRILVLERENQDLKAQNKRLKDCLDDGI